jgi:hypothetical protein
MKTIYKVYEANPKLQYYNNNIDYYTLNTLLKCNVNTMHLQSLELLNVDEKDLHKRVLPSRIVFQQIPSLHKSVHQLFK